MTTIRVTKRTRYAIVAQETVNDTTLSFRARGVLFWLLEKPDDWRCDSASISRSGTEGREAVRTALRELEEAGYLRRTKTHGDGGHWKTIVEVHERPTSAQESGAGSPGVGKPGVGFLGAKRPSTKTQDVDQSSSSSSEPNARGAEGAEEETATPGDHDPIFTAATLHAERALAAQTHQIHDPAAWKAKARRKWLAEHTETCNDHLIETDPEATGQQLLALVDGPRTLPGYVTKPPVRLHEVTDEERRQTEAARAAARRTVKPLARDEATG